MPCFRALSPSELAHTLSVECESESHSVVSDSLWPHGLVHGILQARILEWVAFPFSRGSSQPRDWTQVSHIAVGFFTSWATREAQINPLLVLCCLVAQLYLTLCNPVDCSMPGFPVLHCLLEFAQTHVCWAGATIQSSHLSLDSFCEETLKTSNSPETMVDSVIFKLIGKHSPLAQFYLQIVCNPWYLFTEVQSDSNIRGCQHVKLRLGYGCG